MTGDTAQRLAEEHERTRIVRKAIYDLGWPDREIFLRFYYYAQKISEIADEMHMNTETVKTRLRRGRNKLKAMLGEGDVYD